MAIMGASLISAQVVWFPSAKVDASDSFPIITDGEDDVFQFELTPVANKTKIDENKQVLLLSDTKAVESTHRYNSSSASVGVKLTNDVKGTLYIFGRSSSSTEGLTLTLDGANNIQKTVGIEGKVESGKDPILCNDADIMIGDVVIAGSTTTGKTCFKPIVFDLANTGENTLSWSGKNLNIYAIIFCDEDTSLEDVSIPSLKSVTVSNLVTKISTQSSTPLKAISTDAEVLSVEYYNLAGVKVDAPAKGVNIVKTYYSDGSVVTDKLIK